MDTTTKMKTYKVVRGEIIWLKKDISINLGSNVQDMDRPYVVISNNINNGNDDCPIINIACLTKKVSKSNYPMHVLIQGDKYGLNFDSVICAEQVMTVNKDLISDSIAVLDAEDIKKLDRAIAVQLICERQPAMV